MKELFYRHWMVACLPMAAAISAMLVSSPPDTLALTAIWIQFIVYLLHEFEEHVWPGGFKDYVDERLVGPMLLTRFPDAAIPSRDFPLDDDRAVFWINISFIWIAFPVFALLAGTIDLRFGLFLPWIGLVNASLHVLVAITKRAYNPGLVASVCLNIPSGIWTLVVLSDAGVSGADQLLYFGIAVIGHIGLIATTIPRVRRIVAT